MKVSFYCNKCGKDSDIEEGHGRGKCRFARLSTGEVYLRAACPACKAKVVRYVTERARDPYFLRSKKLRRQRQELRRDLIQPGQPGFQTLYPAQWRQIEEATAKVEAREKAKKQADLEFYKRWRHTKEEESMRRILKET